MTASAKILKCVLVPGAGIEPAWPCGRGILSPLRLPVSPSGLLTFVSVTKIASQRSWASEGKVCHCREDSHSQPGSIERSARSPRISSDYVATASQRSWASEGKECHCREDSHSQPGSIERSAEARASLLITLPLRASAAGRARASMPLPEQLNMCEVCACNVCRRLRSATITTPAGVAR